MLLVLRCEESSTLDVQNRDLPCGRHAASWFQSLETGGLPEEAAVVPREVRTCCPATVADVALES